MHAVKKITYLSDQHSFTLHPSLSPYGQTESRTDGGKNTLAVHGLEEFFSSCAVVSVFGSGGKQVLVLHTYELRVHYSCIVVFGSGRKQFLMLRTSQCTIQLCGCDSFLVVVVNSSQNENTFLQKNLLGYFIMIRQPMCVFIRPNTLLLCIFLFCIFLLYHADLQVEVHIRILLKDKYRKSCQKC